MQRIDLKTAPTQLRTDRLLLETPRAGHAAAFSAGVIQSMPGLDHVAWSRYPCDLPWALHFCEHDARSVGAGEDLVFHAFETASGDWVGRIDVHTIDFDASRGEVGYVGNVQHAGRGLMREATMAVIALCFRLGFERIEAMSDTRNVRALRFAEAIGMQREGVLRRHERDPSGALCDMALYAVLKEGLSGVPSEVPGEVLKPRGY